MSAHKGVNLPNVKLPISAITEKDKIDLQFALSLGVDWICLSFVQSVEDVRMARKLIDGKAWIISKLEKPSAITELDDIIKESDGIMVARGDLGVECPIQTVPVLQKRIVKTCRKYARPVKFSAMCYNLFDKDYWTVARGDQVYLSTPRTFFLSAEFSL